MRVGRLTTETAAPPVLLQDPAARFRNNRGWMTVMSVVPKKDRLSPPLMLAFRNAYAARDARKKLDLRDASGERVIASRRAAGAFCWPPGSVGQALTLWHRNPCDTAVERAYLRPFGSGKNARMECETGDGGGTPPI